MQHHENGGAKNIALVDRIDPITRLVESCTIESSPCRFLVDALQRCAGTKTEGSSEAERIIKSLSSSLDLPWIVTATYSRLRRKENSLPDGTVFTPPWLANEVVKRLLPGLTVVDLGAGSGMLTIAAARKGFRVVAIEENRELATILDSLSRIMGLRGRIELRVGNALSYSRHGAGQIMANPPFTRHHSIPTQKKLALAKMAKDLGLSLHMTTGYFGYFMVYAWTSKWSKRDVLILPTNWLESRYGRALRQMLLTRSFDISLVGNGHDRPIFDHVLTTICLATTWPQNATSNGGKIVTPVSVLRELNGVAKKRSSEDQLAARLGQRLNNSVQRPPKADYVVANIFRVRRGIATGQNEFFILSKASARNLGIGRRELRRIVRRLPSDSHPINIEYLWVPDDNPSEASLRRITEGEKLGVNQRYLCKHRKPWWRVQVCGPPDYFLSYMGSGRPRIVENREGLLNLNNTHGLYMKEEVPIGLARRVVRWLNSQEGIEALSSQARHYFGGMWKLEPGDAERTSLPTTFSSPAKHARDSS